jgi:SH3-like domain-containing protein
MRYHYRWIILIALCLGLMPAIGMTQTVQKIGDSGLPVPRFVSLTADKVYLRTGPGKRYPIKKVYQANRYPLEVVGEYDHWRQIRDIDDTTGWIHVSLLTGYRSFLATGDPVRVYDDPDASGNLILKLEQGVWGRITQCRANFCELSVQEFNGWANKSDIWGVYPGETFD